MTLIKNRFAPKIRKSTRTVSSRRQQAYANDFSALNPTIWANEAILRLVPNLVMGNLVHRDFDNVVHKFGDLVNAFIPGNFVMKRKGALCENVQTQDASGSTVQVPLDQWPHVSFVICDGEEDRNALDLVETLLVPAVDAIAVGIDAIIGGQVYQFLENNAGQLGKLDKTNVRDYMLDARQVMNDHGVADANRIMAWTSQSETEALKVDLFVSANQVGDDGSALRNASLGVKYGWNNIRNQGQPAPRAGSQTLVTTTTTAAYPAGTTTGIVLASGTGLAVGQWVVIDGDGIPQQITALATATISIAPGLKRAVASGASVKAIKSAAINNAAGYNGTTTSPHVIGYAKSIAIDGIPASPPQIGQFVTFGVDATKYTIIGLDVIDNAAGTFAIMLDRPLVNALVDNATVNFGPTGQYNFGFLANAFALVNRPLPQPRAGTGALSKVVVDPRGKISLRVTISYDPVAQGHRVTIDTLIGVGILSHNYGVVMLG